MKEEPCGPKAAVRQALNPIASVVCGVMSSGVLAGRENIGYTHESGKLDEENW